MIAALFVEKGGPYFGIDGVDPWPIERDARKYDGPHPVVAHPPCGPWGRLRLMCRNQDASCGPHAVEMVRRFGGVFEHPADSILFRYCALPFPGELPDALGGRTYGLRQVSWGHCCEKPTWIYVVGVPAKTVVAGLRTGGVATRRIANGDALPSASKRARILTPRPFAEWLIALARSAEKDGAR